MKHGLSTGLSAYALAAALGGCAPDETPAAPSSLLDVEIPADFTFATSKPFALRAAGNAEKVASTLVEVRLPNGSLVHRGPLASPIRVSIPTATEKLSLLLRDPSGERALEVPATGADAVVTVE